MTDQILILQRMSMKKQIIQITITLLMLFTFSGCKKDKGNYTYTDANDITITTDMTTADPLVVINNDSLVVKENDSLKLDVLITQRVASNDLSYQWLITQIAANLSNPAQYVVGTTKALRIKIVLPP